MGGLPPHSELVEAARSALNRVGAEWPAGDGVRGRTPITGGTLFDLAPSSRDDVDGALGRAAEAFRSWRSVPAPKRADVVRELAGLLRAHQADLADLVTLETGKIRSEALGEVQEMIDICDLAVGLSRQLYGRTMASERPEHRMSEVWLPLGVCGVITAFNFPVAVWAWNAAIALVCGDPVVWKPSEKAPLCALACQALIERAGAPAGVSQVVLGGAEVGGWLVDDGRVALVSATGSTRMGRAVGPRVAARFGRSLLELGGNNAAIVAPSADLDLTVRAVAFAAAGTAGQRCTTLRRVIAHRSLVGELVDRLARAYKSLPVGDPRAPGTLVGPLIDVGAYEAFAAARDEVEVVAGGERELADEAPDAFYVRPAVAVVAQQTPLVLRETFGPLLYVLAYDEWDEAMALHNAVPYGLSSSLFTRDLVEAERFVSAAGSDCGIANINIGPSGAEIGGAFGGEKETGGGREAGSDAWKGYMRRLTTTVNASPKLPLAQGVEFL